MPQHNGQCNTTLRQDLGFSWEERENDLLASFDYSMQCHNTSSHDAKDINRSHVMDVKGTGYRLALTNSEGFYDKWGIGNHLADGSW